MLSFINHHSIYLYLEMQFNYGLSEVSVQNPIFVDNR